MYYEHLETSAENKRTHNANMMYAAAQRRASFKHIKRPPAAHNSTAAKRLNIRVKDYEATISGKGDYSGFHKPGSMAK